MHTYMYTYIHIGSREAPETRAPPGFGDETQEMVERTEACRCRRKRAAAVPS